MRWNPHSDAEIHAWDLDPGQLASEGRAKSSYQPRGFLESVKTSPWLVDSKYQMSSSLERPLLSQVPPGDPMHTQVERLAKLCFAWWIYAWAFAIWREIFLFLRAGWVTALYFPSRGKVTDTGRWWGTSSPMACHFAGIFVPGMDYQEWMLL